MIARLHALGIEVDEDGAGAALGGDCGNLLARIPGSGEGSLLLCAHLDTVPLAAPIEPVDPRRRLGERERGDPRRRQQGRGRDDADASPSGSPRAPARRGVELLFTVGEEVALQRRQGVRGRPAAQHARLHLRQRDAGRRRRRRLADLLPHHRRAARRRRARRACAPSSGRSAIVAAARAIAAMRARPPRRGDDREHRH